jgi:hypothetical protein
MYDISHQWGSDLCLGPTGDVATVCSPSLTRQRVLRRLFTNPLDYIWQPAYGAGLAGFVGEPVGEAQIGAVIRGQIFKEASVLQSPAPTIDLSIGHGTDIGCVYISISYSDAGANEAQVLSFSLRV